MRRSRGTQERPNSVVTQIYFYVRRVPSVALSDSTQCPRLCTTHLFGGTVTPVQAHRPRLLWSSVCTCLGLRVEGLGFGVEGLGGQKAGKGFKVQLLGFSF